MDANASSSGGTLEPLPGYGHAVLKLAKLLTR